METRADRVLIACKTCGRQYDVTGMSVGSRVRCECGLSLTLEERGLPGACPKCGARLLDGSGSCTECGVEISPQALRPVREGAVCPRCKGMLRSRSVGTTALVECGNCAGIWLSAEELDRICQSPDVENLVRQHLAELEPANPAISTDGLAYLHCPTCGELMNRKNFGTRSGVIVDVCKPHGVWLDHRELDRIVEFVRGGGLERAREAEMESLKIEAEHALAMSSHSVSRARTMGRYGRRSLLEEVLIALSVGVSIRG
jgi:Zn-finger nucleic acid-binding protein